tara:strand:- start:181 stop:399 length:219 start_codon:yes stop_codon:yes gene_type:complete
MKKIECVINGKFFSSKSLENSLDSVIASFLRKKIKRNIAVAVNDELIQKAEWRSKKISNGDRIEIVYPFNGG